MTINENLNNAVQTKLTPISCEKWNDTEIHNQSEGVILSVMLYMVEDNVMDKSSPLTMVTQKKKFKQLRSAPMQFIDVKRVPFYGQRTY